MKKTESPAEAAAAPAEVPAAPAPATYPTKGGSYVRDRRTGDLNKKGN
jgi:hypothetical protein